MIVVDLGGLKSRKESEDIITVNVGGLGDVEHDLNTFPYPFESESVDEVRLIQTLEHLDEPYFKVMPEIWRILKVGGSCVIEVPMA